MCQGHNAPLPTPARDVHVLIPVGKEDFADVIKVRDLEMGEVFLDYPGGPNLITSP